MIRACDASPGRRRGGVAGRAAAPRSNSAPIAGYRAVAPRDDQCPALLLVVRGDSGPGSSGAPLLPQRDGNAGPARGLRRVVRHTHFRWHVRARNYANAVKPQWGRAEDLRRTAEYYRTDGVVVYRSDDKGIEERPARTRNLLHGIRAGAFPTSLTTRRSSRRPRRGGADAMAQSDESELAWRSERISAWWTSRSIIAVAVTSSPKISPHAEKGLLLVTITLARS